MCLSEQKILTFDVLVKDIVDHRIDVFVDVFKEKWKAVFDGQFELLEEIWIVESTCLKEEYKNFIR